MVIEFLGIDQCGDSTVVVSVKKGREFLGIDQCGGDSISPTPTPTPTSTATPTPTPSPTATPTPSTTPSITPSPSNLGVAFSVIGSAGDLNSLCDKTTGFPVFVHAPEAAANADNCQSIPTRFYTNTALTVPFNGQDRYYKKACPALGTYKVLVFSIGTNGVRGGLFEENCLPYVTPSPTVSLTPSITPSPSPSQTPDASCNFTFEIILPVATPSPTPTPTPTSSITATPTASITPSPTPTPSPSPLGVAITLYGEYPEIQNLCQGTGATRLKYVRTVAMRDGLIGCSFVPNIIVYSDINLTIPFDGSAYYYSAQESAVSGRCRFQIAHDGSVIITNASRCP